MSLARDLLAQARHLATVDKKRPKQANLRRAVSAAYYALFHQLISDGAAVAGAKLKRQARARLARAFAHADMKVVCASYAKATTAAAFHPQVSPLLTFPLPPELLSVAGAFVELQEARHLADYDVWTRWDRLAVLSRVQDAEDALADWEAIKGTSAASVFLMDLLLRKNWARP